MSKAHSITNVVCPSSKAELPQFSKKEYGLNAQWVLIHFGEKRYVSATATTINNNNNNNGNDNINNGNGNGNGNINNDNSNKREGTATYFSFSPFVHDEKECL